MIEIGSYAGDSTQLFWMYFSPVIAIDPHNWFMEPHKSTEEVAAIFKANTEWRDIQHIKMFSDDAFKWQNQSLLPHWVSCVYIDGDHSYGACKQDILNSWPFICDDGFICGHDYGLNTSGAIASKQDGVKQAVDEMFGQPDRLYEDTSWVVQKKNGRMII